MCTSLKWLCTALALGLSSCAFAAEPDELPLGMRDPCRGTVMHQSWRQYGGRMRPYTKEMMRKDFPRGRKRRTSRRDSKGMPMSKSVGFIFARGLERAAVGDGQLRTKHPKGCVGTNECGLLFGVRLPEIYESATVSYWFRFSRGFHWTSGGKLPGVCSERCPSGCTRDVEGSYSARVMWRKQGELESYMYYPGKKARCGDSWLWGKRADDKWHFVKLYVRMNAIGKSNGVHRVWLDGKRVFNRTDVVYRTRGDVGVERFTFRNFHGGRSSAFRPNQTQYNWFDDVRVEAGECPGGPLTPRPKISRPPRGEEVVTARSPRVQALLDSVSAYRPSALYDSAARTMHNIFSAGKRVAVATGW